MTRRPQRSVVACFWLAVATSLFACRAAPPGGPLRGGDVVLVVVDTLRADHLGFAGYRRPTSSFLDRLAGESTVFLHAVAPSSYTRESVSALFTGRWPSCLGATGWNAAPRMGVTLAERLRRAGYTTAMLTLTTMLADPAFARGFERVEHLAQQWGVSRAGPQLTRRALEVWREPRTRPLFLYLHYLDPHGPYDPPPEMLARFGDGGSDALDLYRDVRPRLADLERSGFGPGEARFEALVRRYDAEIAHTDMALEQLVSGLRSGSRSRPLLLVVTADHGEEFLEHGFVEHAWTLYEESVRVPFLWWSPGVLPPARSTAPTSLVDVVPTLEFLLRLPEEARAASTDGVVLFEHSGHGVRPRSLPERVRWSELGIAERNVARAVWLGKWKYIAARRWLLPAERSAVSAVEDRWRAEDRGPPPPPPDALAYEALFDLTVDPGERHNQLPFQPAVVAQLRTLVAQHEQRCPLTGTGKVPRPTLAPHEEEALRALGY